MCVTERDRSLAELERIAAEWRGRPGVLGAYAGVLTDTVAVTAYVVPAEWQREADRRYGPEVIIFDGRLKPAN